VIPQQSHDAVPLPPDVPASALLPNIRVPTLAIVGALDQPDMHSIADLLAEKVPDARKVVMPGTAHVPHMERPEEFNRIVLDFLREACG
jgi:pimeloyl-ACP methyl ester carboxylesterase